MKCRTCGLVTHKQCYGAADHHYIKKTNSVNSCNASPIVIDNASERSLHELDCPPSGDLPRSHPPPPKHRTMSDSACDFGRMPKHDSGQAGAAMTGLLRIVRWLSHRRKAKELNYKNNPAALEKHVKSRFGLHTKLDDKETKKKLKALLKSTQNYQRQLYNGMTTNQQQQQQPGTYQEQQFSHHHNHHPLQRHRFLSARSASSSSSTGRQRRLFRSMAIRSDSSAVSSPQSSVSSSTEYSTPFGTPTFGGGKTASQQRPSPNHASSAKHLNADSLEADEKCSSYEKHDHQTAADSYLSLQESHAKLSTTTKPVLLPECSGWTFGANVKGLNNKNFQTLTSRQLTNARITAEASKNSKMVSKTLKLNKPPVIAKAKTLSIESHNLSNESLCATWPPLGKAGTIAEETSDEGEYVEASDDLSSDLSSECCPLREEALNEWCIPFDDIEFAERVRSGRCGDIYKGRWYGEVLIYTIRDTGDSEIKKFLEEVLQMGMIRHENIVLFMGACIKPPKLAVITSMRKGPTLYEYVHLKRNRLPFHSKLNIARQIAQGMGYLHAKGITHRRLNSKNIILESRVKLCMMDHAMADRNFDRSDRGCIPRGQLTYISPELMRTLQIEPPRIYPAASYTQYSDIFAFGSLLYELLAERFPFHDQHPQAVIWKVAAGKRASLEHFRFINGLKALIRKCWSQTPQNRPPFSEIVNKLLENVSNHKRHSSVPDKLHYAGHNIRRNMCT